MATTPLHVIIIGAGTGGMCLAHGLKRAGISVAVYERDRTRTAGLHGYRVGIDPHGSRALKACLPPDLYETFVATCARDPKYFVFLDEHLKPTITIPLREGLDEVDSEKSVSRMTLRQVLFTGMEDHIHFGKTFTHYERREDGKVTAFFEDGSSAVGDVLVAADGANSRVRKQYLPHAQVEDARIISITAKVPLTEESKALLPKGLFPGIGLVVAPKGYSCILHWMEFPWDREGGLKNNIGGNDADLLANWPGLLFDNTRDYINWGFWASTDKFPADVMQRGGKELIQLALEMTPNWSPELRKLFSMGDPTTCFPINIRTSVPIEPWPSSNITLLGDAIHTMTPGQGVGANTALRDAHAIVRALTAVRDGRKPLVQAIHDYEGKMIDYGFKAVLESKKQTSGDQPIHKPYVGRLALAGMRGYLRLADRVPAMKRKMADDIYRYRGGEDED